MSHSGLKSKKDHVVSRKRNSGDALLLLLLHATLFAVVVTSFLPAALAECWDTGCQSDTWAVKGCRPYGMVEVNRTRCPGGDVFTCCDKSDGLFGDTTKVRFQRVP